MGSGQMDALKSPFLSTRSLVTLSRTSSLRGSALRNLSFRVEMQTQAQKATPQRRSSRHTDGYPHLVQANGTCHAA